MRLTAGQRAFSAAVIYERRVCALVVVLLVLICGDLFQVALGSEFPAGRVKTLLLVGPVFALVMLHFGYLLRGLFAAPELVVLVALVPLSVLWSVDPAQTLERSIGFLVFTGLAITLGSMLSLRSLILLIAALTAVMTLVSLVAIGVLPAARGIEPWPNTWRGIFNHKNGLGAFSAVAAVALIAAAVITRGGTRQTFIGFALLALVLLVASNSRTSQIVALLSVLAFTLAVVFRDYLRLWAVGYVGALLLFVGFAYLGFATGAIETVFLALDRKPTLSGRIPLWELVWPFVMERPWLGWGYDAFWNPDAVRVMTIARDASLGFTPHYSHNGLVETMLNVGILGVPLFLLAMGRALAGIMLVAGHRRAQVSAACALVLLLMFVLFNITEATLLARDSPGWFIAVALITKFSLILQRRPGRGMQRRPVRRQMPQRRLVSGGAGTH